MLAYFRQLIRRIPVNIMSILLFSYMTMAFGWWALHLWRQNEHLFKTEVDLLEWRLSAGNGINVTELAHTKEYQLLEKKYHSAHKMIMGESLFMVFCLLIGLYLINLSAKRQLATARQQRNFLLSITHELKSPLASIQLALETIRKRNLSKEQSDHMADAGLRENERLNRLVEDLLLTARLEDHWEPVMEAVSIAPLLDNILSPLKLKCPQVHFDVALAPDCPIISADPGGLRAILQNLLENAVKYAGESAQIGIQTKCLPNHIVFTISDNGPGVPENAKSLIFNKFYRMGNEMTRQTKGTGLGLYIVKQIARAHGGTVVVSDNIPNGAIFTVNLPIA